MHIDAAPGNPDGVLPINQITLWGNQITLWGIERNADGPRIEHDVPLLFQNPERANRRVEARLTQRRRHLPHHLLVDTDGERMCGDVGYGHDRCAVSKLVDMPPAKTATWVWAGQNPSGIHCTTASLRHTNRPVVFFDDVIVIDSSAAARSATGLVNLTTSGCATLTTAPGDGSIVSAAKTEVGDESDAQPTLSDLIIAVATTPTVKSAQLPSDSWIDRHSEPRERMPLDALTAFYVRT